MNYQKYLSEAAGTFALVFCGTGAIVINQVSGGMISHLGICLTAGMIVTAMIFALGDISGAHFNPAVTLGFALTKRFPVKEILPYVLSQAIGAFAASFLLHVLFPANETLGATLPSGSEMQSFILETVLAAILILVILNVSTGSKEKGITAAIAIGATVGLEALFAGPVCGASMNPVRSLSPAIVSGHTEHLWIYLLAPVCGAFIGFVLHTVLYRNSNTAG